MRAATASTITAKLVTKVSLLGSGLLWAVGVSLVVGLMSGCMDRSPWSCNRSSQCPDGQFCRVGECVPAVGFVAGDAATAAIAADAAGAVDEADVAAPRCEEGSVPAEGELVLNEVLVNVPGGDEGDANGDGIRDAYEDEFVEIVNRTEQTLDLTGVAVRNGSSDKFVFGPTCLEAHQAAIVFGGGQPAERPGMLVRVAASRFAFGNSGGSVVLAGADGALLGAINYSNAPAEALTLSPQLAGADFVDHSTLSEGVLLSPGTCPGGELFSDGCDNTSP
jgi:hypothetical protein